MARAAREQTLYAALEALPEGITGEILDGQLHTQPRHAAPHVSSVSSLAMELGGPYSRGRGGPGGWWILVAPELHFVWDTEVAVPDLAGWRRERMPEMPEGHRLEKEMAKVTSKLQITIPKKIAEQYGIKPGDELEFVPRAGGIRLVPAGTWRQPRLSPEERVRLFDDSTKRADQRAKELGIKPVEDESKRGWTREELYTRDYKPR